ncbi:hypothetical protein [Pedobacter sp. R20-19]|uniref:hypothetical protein n=1 Tax=Pedobacter sp. R20-19 TaxID=1270196 RepID=UPI0004930A66|nr:hypothetical protein [Pedobacter sp. R20-19]
MRKFKLDADGLQGLLKEIYALPDQQLQQHAGLIVANFKLWVGSNFELQNSQLDYLNKISDLFITAAAAELSRFVGKRLPVSFIKTPSGKHSANTAEAQDKVVVVHKEKKVSATASGAYLEEERLVYKIMYE